MVAHFTLRTYGVNQEFRFAEGIWLHRKSRRIPFYFRKKTFFTSYMRNMFWATISYKNHAEGEEIMNTSMSVHKTSLPPAVPAQQIMG